MVHQERRHGGGTEGKGLTVPQKARSLARRPVLGEERRFAQDAVGRFPDEDRHLGGDPGHQAEVVDMRVGQNDADQRRVVLPKPGDIGERQLGIGRRVEWPAE